MSGGLLFLVDDDETLRHVLARELAGFGYEVRAFASADGVVAAVLERGPDALLVDLRMPGMDGLELLRALREADADTQVVLLTGHGAVPEAVEAMRRGAHDFLTKPVRLEVLEQVLRRAVERRRLVLENRRLRDALAGGAERPLLGRSPAMAALGAAIERVARSHAAVLVQGENGTGKELVARRLHQLSPRATGPFVAVNCGAIPTGLVEAELFGHERGAFTGAERKRSGLFEAADGGTLFLDEIGELPLTVQPALLRALQFGEIRPVGAERSRRVDVRLISATNRRLLEGVERGEFREDLYYRVAALTLDVPPLRERGADVELLARAFLERARVAHGRAIEFDPQALERLSAHAWRGNVRELENAVERLVVMCDGPRIDAAAVERHVLQVSRAAGPLPTLELAQLERLAIAAALERHGGDKRAAAATLGIALRTLYNKLG
ncbi:MAG: sigma-54-dependent Fis family transcriptional regulator [Planctomycetota bacterium]|nr:MAG: sigma-54-dependent Fis family transcriptional regulator [Planctomycetota bacterium]